ncbi:acetyltransferase [Pseudomonas aeruginosa]|nr:acetyltransferase [Pseudomonas aeruginosa]CCQ84551.1 hypothetical protein PA18A_1134 [Pseudomonas aeruginosa 18A]MCO3781575.1 acetyltransferase [Pseudomonas aeruginosa]OUL51556.1 acetyltransferase [Pseudomonas aeruginosa]RQD25687.1 acetyltransferase [Pseudomonas aeruginosa]
MSINRSCAKPRRQEGSGCTDFLPSLEIASCPMYKMPAGLPRSRR